MRKILLVALTAAAMVSCSENEGFENESTMNRIKFGTVVKTGTKTLVATTENFSKFTVSAYKTTDDMGGTVQLNTGFMDDIEVDKSSGEWKYKGDYYWPVSGKLQFFATSPPTSGEEEEIQPAPDGEIHIEVPVPDGQITVEVDKEEDGNSGIGGDIGDWDDETNVDIIV